MRRKHKLPLVMGTPVIPKMTEEEIDREDKIVEGIIITRSSNAIEELNTLTNINDILEEQRERSRRCY